MNVRKNKMELAGKIEKIFDKNQAGQELMTKGMKPYKKFIVDGVYFNDFNKIIDNFKENDQVVVSYTQNGNFTNLEGCRIYEVGKETIKSEKPIIINEQAFGLACHLAQRSLKEFDLGMYSERVKLFYKANKDILDNMR